jgi:hypothetical protein
LAGSQFQTYTSTGTPSLHGIKLDGNHLSLRAEITSSSAIQVHRQ